MCVRLFYDAIPLWINGIRFVLMALQPSVTIGGQAARMQFSGIAPGCVCPWQINVVAPHVAAGPVVPVSVSIGGMASSTGTISVH